jgi:predicted PurR-regulated permease PerM
MTKESKTVFPFSVELAAYLLIGSFAILVMFLGQFILVPFSFSIVFSVLLLPICRLFERVRFSKVWAIVSALVLVNFFLAGLIMFFGSQISALFTEVTDFKQNLERLFYEVLDFAAQNLNITNKEILKALADNKSKLIQTGTNLLQSTVNTGGDFLTFGSLSIVFTFLILLYRSGFRHYILLFFLVEKREGINKIMNEIQAVIINYFQGVLLVMLIIGTLNSIGLSLLGIEYAILFGFLGSILTIIPYIGTTFGAGLPFLFALINYQESWRALGIIPMNLVIQQLEANFITPKIVGGKVSVNALFAFIGLLVGGIFWGVAGMILAIPLTAIVKTITYYIPETQKFSYLLSDDFPSKSFEDYLAGYRKFKETQIAVDSK